MSEILGLLFAVLVGTLFVPRMMDIQQSSNDNTRAAITAQQQVQLIKASTAYIQDNAVALQAVATATTPAVVTVAMLKAPAVGLLPASFNDTNPYNQTWEVQVLEPTAGNLEALVMSKGGTQLKDLDAARVASLVGASGGIIPLNDSGIYAGGSANAYGSYNGWQVSTANYSSITGGQLASLLWFNSGQLVSSYLYRNQVAGQPQLNTMETPLIMGAGTVQTEGSACVTFGSIGRNAAGALLACDNGVWKAGGSAYWQDSVSTFASLPTCDAAAVNQTRVVQTPSVGSGARAYTCDGAGSWNPLGVDDTGQLTVASTTSTGMLQLNSVVTVGAACTTNGQVAQDGSGIILSCQSGVWEKATGEAASVPNLYVFETSGTFTIPSSKCKATVTGGGGGGGSGIEMGGGGGAGTAIRVLDGLIPGLTLTVTVGNGGPGGGWGGNSIVSSGTQSIASIIGGGGGTPPARMYGGPGGTSSGGQINAFGGPGEYYAGHIGYPVGGNSYWGGGGMSQPGRSYGGGGSQFQPGGRGVVVFEC